MLTLAPDLLGKSGVWCSAGVFVNSKEEVCVFLRESASWGLKNMIHLETLISGWIMFLFICHCVRFTAIAKHACGKQFHSSCEKYFRHEFH
jgi:hypothetical protein